MANLLEQLGFRKRTHVGISLSANNFIELVCVDKITKTVSKYVSGNVKYNNAIREIMDYEEFTEVVENLFSEAGLLPSECSVTLNLPNVHFGLTQFESTYEAPFIIENLQMEIEDLYIFKRNEPSISYSILSSASTRNQQTVAYSAMQTNVIGRIIEIFDALQIELVRIDSSYSSLIKAIQYTDRFSKYFENEEKTLVVLITQSSCNTFSFIGKKLYDYTEEPIAVRSLSIEEVYSTVLKTSNTVKSKENPQNLLIISETDEVNAELLASRIDFAGQNDYINKSLNRSDTFIDISGSQTDIDSNMVAYMTIEAVGAAVADYDEFETNINFMPQDRINANLIEVFDYEIDLYRFILIVVAAATLSAVLLALFINLLLTASIDNLQTKKMSSDNDINAFQRRVNEDKTKEKKKIFPVLKKTLENNTAILNAYIQLATDIPDDVYITKFVCNPQGGIGIQGEAKSSELVEVFVNKLRENNADLMVSKVSINSDDSVITGSSSRKGLSFEIKTASKDVSFNGQENVLQQAINNNNNSNNNIFPRRRQTGGALTPPPPVI